MADSGKALSPPPFRLLSVVSVGASFPHQRGGMLIKEDTDLSVYQKPYQGTHSSQPSYSDPLQFNAQETQSRPLPLRGSLLSAKTAYILLWLSCKWSVILLIFVSLIYQHQVKSMRVKGRYDVHCTGGKQAESLCYMHRGRRRRCSVS